MNGKRTTAFYIQRISGFILLLVLAAVFLFSGISKLYAFEQFMWNIMDVGITHMMLAGIIARLFIAFELLLGTFLALHLYLRSFTYPAVMGMLVFFTIYLIFLISTQGDGGNCGCFGDAYEMKPSAAILKNMVMLGMTALLWSIYPVKPYRASYWIAGAVTMLALTIPFILFPPNKDKVPDKTYEPIDLNALYEEHPAPSVDVRKGKHIVSFMSLSCPHCKKAAFLFHVIHKQHPEIPIQLVLWGSDKYEKEFFEETKAQDVPHIRMKNTEAFTFYAKEGVPAIYFIKNSIIERKATYYQINPENIKEWLEKQ
ncbi:MAG TPA: MauE/DoxX family redox-associated membrane protein [Flavipsychrobacter sp.]|nr:MauE/DoxX family redox-associated membrane protein [Flavipsychrobacter sp.]